MKKEAAVVLELREELENAQQEGAKSLESAEAKEAKLIGEIKELKNETEKLKVCHVFLFCWSNELMAMHQTEKAKQARELQARRLELKSSEETVVALKSESAALESQIEVDRVSTHFYLIVVT